MSSTSLNGPQPGMGARPSCTVNAWWGPTDHLSTQWYLIAVLFSQPESSPPKACQKHGLAWTWWSATYAFCNTQVSYSENYWWHPFCCRFCFRLEISCGQNAVPHLYHRALCASSAEPLTGPQMLIWVRQMIWSRTMRMQSSLFCLVVLETLKPWNEIWLMSATSWF